MSPALSNHKKVRGWPRRLRQLDALRRRRAVPDEALLARYGRDYVKLALDPWNRLVGRNPPVWYRRRVLAAFLDLHARWDAHLAARGEPYYLALWLFHPRFHRTQLVAGVGDQIAHYEGVFPPDPSAPSRPPARYDDPAYDLGALRWTPGVDADHAFRSDLDLYPESARWFERRRGHVVAEETLADGDRLYLLKSGTVWVGRR